MTNKDELVSLPFNTKCRIIDTNGNVLVQEGYYVASCYDFINDKIIYSIHGPFIKGVSTIIYSFEDSEIESVN